MIRKRYFYSRLEAEAFATGVEFVNDSALKILDIDKDDKARKDDDPLVRWYVKVEDRR